ncbi:hypothetical protein CP8484711_1092A, partial [Chlamydia psittaci 84-8471/1]|jgi:hypothetical protein
MQQT